MWKTLSGPSAIIAIAGWAWKGDIIGEKVLLEHLPDIGSFIQSNAAFPNLFITMIGIFIGCVIFPFIGRSIKWRGDFNAYIERRNEIFNSYKGDFHTILNQAYASWAATKQYTPIELNSLVDKSGRFNKEGLLSNRINKIQGALINSNVDLWDFSYNLMTEIERTKKDANFSPTLLSAQDCIKFSTARRAMKEFWDAEGRRIYEGTGFLFAHIWLRKLKPDLTDRSMLIIPFIEVALAKINNMPTFGGVYLRRLCLKGNTLWLAATD